MHVTETCDDGTPPLITHIETAAGPAADGDATPAIHAALQERDLLPAVRRTRYVGQTKTHLGHILTATGLNFLRLGEWFSDRPRAKTRHTLFSKLMAQPVAT